MEGFSTIQPPTGTGGFLHPERTIAHLGIGKGEHVADFGCGHGYFSIPLARAVGPDGKIYAVDIMKAALDAVRKKAEHDHILNIETVWGDLDTAGGSHIQENFIEHVLVANTLFQAENKEGVLREAHRVLKAGGTLTVIDWDQSTSPLGPPMNQRIRKEQARALAEGLGFGFKKEIHTGSHHYGLVFVKQ